MLEYDRTDVEEGIDVKQLGGDTSRECDLCHFFYFIDKNFNYHSFYCNGCHNISVESISMKNLGIDYVRNKAYRITFAFMDYNDAVNLLHNISLIDKKGIL